MTLEDKIELCEKLLVNYDLLSDSDDFTDGSDSQEYLFQRCRLILLILNKLELFNVSNLVQGSAETFDNLVLDNLFYTFINNSLCWELQMVNSEIIGFDDCTHGFSFLLQKDKELDKSLIACKKEIFDMLHSIHPLLKNKKFLPMVIMALESNDSDEYYSMNCLVCKHIVELLENNAIKSECLNPLKSPLLLHPECENVCSENYEVCAWLTGYSPYYREQYLYLICVNSMFFVCLYYVELAYMKYSKTKKTELNINGFCFN